MPSRQLLSLLHRRIDPAFRPGQDRSRWRLGAQASGIRARGSLRWIRATHEFQERSKLPGGQSRPFRAMLRSGGSDTAHPRGVCEAMAGVCLRQRRRDRSGLRPGRAAEMLDERRSGWHRSMCLWVFDPKSIQICEEHPASSLKKKSDEDVTQLAVQTMRRPMWRWLLLLPLAFGQYGALDVL